MLFNTEQEKGIVREIQENFHFRVKYQGYVRFFEEHVNFQNASSRFLYMAFS